MNIYQFETVVTMKPYNSDRYWIDRNVIRTMRIESQTIEEALNVYSDRVKEKDYISISGNALKHKDAMYREKADGSSCQVGYVITGHTYIDDDRGNYTKQFVDLWVEIMRIENAFAA